MLSAFAYVVSIWHSFKVFSVKTFSISLPVLSIKMQFTFLGKIWYSKMPFHCESECTFPWNKNSGKEKKCYWKCWTNYIVISTRLYKKKERTSKSKWRALVFLSYFEKISTFFCSCSILSVQRFPYETFWECSVLALTPSSCLIQLAVSNYILKMNYEAFFSFVFSHWCFF